MKAQPRNWSVGAATLLLALLAGAIANAKASVPAQPDELKWFSLSDTSKFKVLGLHWFEQNQPKLWRLPAQQFESLPKGVQGRARCTSGARVLLRCNTQKLALNVTGPRSVPPRAFDLYIDGQLAQPAVAKRGGGETNLVVFDCLDARPKELVVYLPHNQEIIVHNIGVDTNTQFSPPKHHFARPLPVVFYGSSVCQGSGAAHAGMTYEAILCRELNLDFINLGFGGAGKAESNVVALVNSVLACCYVFDLGKSYGTQDATAYKAMLQAVRKAHPDTPILCLTPITSAREVRDPSYSERSVHTRTVMREPVNELIQAGDKRLVLIEGADLLGFSDHGGLSRDGVHPSDQGYAIIARKLQPVLKKALGL